MCLIQIKHTQMKIPLWSFWTVWAAGSHTGRRFLNDTGTSYIIFPHRVTAERPDPDWGERPADTMLGREGGPAGFPRPPIRLDVFLLADVTFAIIGVNFLLLVEPAANRLVDTASLQCFATILAAASCAASAIQSPPSPKSADSCGGTPPPRGQPDATHHRRCRRSGWRSSWQSLRMWSAPPRSCRRWARMWRPRVRPSPPASGGWTRRRLYFIYLKRKQIMKTVAKLG